MIVDGTDLRTLGFIPQRRQLPRLGGERSVYTPLPGQMGAAYLGRLTEPAELSVDGIIRGTSHADALAKLDTITAAVRGKERVLRFSDITDREWLGRLQAPSSARDIVPQWIGRAIHLTLAFALPDPYARAQAVTNHGGSGALSLGTAPSLLVGTLTAGSGTITQVRMSVKTAGGAGAFLSDLIWNGSLAPGQALVIDAEKFTVTKAGANAIGGLTASSTFPIADPAKGADYVTINVTGGDSTGYTRSIAYRKRWA